MYTEKLGKEMGIYETPYEDFGRSTCRDAARRAPEDRHRRAPQGLEPRPGLAYLRDHTALSEHEVTTEVDRYISWRGQVLSYKLGEIAIVRLRAEAERANWVRKFDIKAFHDAVLKQGSVTLPVLESLASAPSSPPARPARPRRPQAAP